MHTHTRTHTTCAGGRHGGYSADQPVQQAPSQSARTTAIPLYLQETGFKRFCGCLKLHTILNPIFTCITAFPIQTCDEQVRHMRDYQQQIIERLQQCTVIKVS